MFCCRAALLVGSPAGKELAPFCQEKSRGGPLIPLCLKGLRYLGRVEAAAQAVGLCEGLRGW